MRLDNKSQVWGWWKTGILSDVKSRQLCEEMLGVTTIWHLKREGGVRWWWSVPNTTVTCQCNLCAWLGDGQLDWRESD